MKAHSSNRHRLAQRLLEIYRSSNYRTTASGRKVAWDEPGEDDTPEVRRHNASLTQRQQQQNNSKNRLKSKGIVPTKAGKPIFERASKAWSTADQYLQALEHLYASTSNQTFEQWVLEVVKVLDDLP